MVQSNNPSQTDASCSTPNTEQRTPNPDVRSAHRDYPPFGRLAPNPNPLTPNNQLLQAPFRYMVHAFFIAPVLDIIVLHLFDDDCFGGFAQGDDMEDIQVAGQIQRR